jgi:hypothetical protein
VVGREHEPARGNVLAAGDPRPEGEPEERAADDDEQAIQHGATLCRGPAQRTFTFAQLGALAFPNASFATT